MSLEWRKTSVEAQREARTYARQREDAAAIAFVVLAEGGQIDAVTSDPADKWPEWSQPLGAHDAYSKGDQVSHNGKHWISTADANVWEPGVYGWEEQAGD